MVSPRKAIKGSLKYPKGLRNSSETEQIKENAVNFFTGQNSK